MDPKHLKVGFDAMLQADTSIRRQKRTEKNKKKTLFLSLIKKYDESLIKSIMIQSQFGLDLSPYEEPLFNIIDDLLLLNFGDDIYQLIAFYFYERINSETGEEQFIVGPDMQPIFIKTPLDLYNTIEKLYPNTFS